MKQETAQQKARKTTLSKKSTSELINIILRKDEVERKLNSKITKLVKDYSNACDDITSYKTRLQHVTNVYEAAKNNSNATENKLNAIIDEDAKQIGVLHNLVDKYIGLNKCLLATIGTSIILNIVLFVTLLF